MDVDCPTDAKSPKKSQISTPKWKPARLFASGAMKKQQKDIARVEKALVNEDEAIQRELKKRERKDVRKQEQAVAKTLWKLSEPAGGRMMNLDPVFTGNENIPDKKFLIIAYRLSLHVYSSSTSLLVRSIPLAVNKANEKSTRIVSYCLSPTNSSLCWAACSDGAVFLVDWTTGAGAEDYWSTSSTGVVYMTVASMESLGRKRDTVFTTEPHKEGGYRITAHELTSPGDAIAPASRKIFTIKQPIHVMKALANGEIIVAAAENKVLIGAIRRPDFGTIDNIKYTFQLFEVTDPIACLDARVGGGSQTTSSTKEETAKKSGSNSNVIDVVIGDVKGAIFVYLDILVNLKRAIKLGGQPVSPRKHHWHRKAVQSVKWSLDGNYIISGGSETVLVLCQLDTGHLQFLPHLSAAIQNIVVSPLGKSYAVHIADNSTMILSTSELKPTANFAGIQAPVIEPTKNLDSYVKRIDNQQSSAVFLNPTPAVINPSDPSRLLLAVGEMQEFGPAASAIESSPYLQTFDISNSQNLGRQALTRTNITVKNVAPDGYRLIEPKTTHMQISCDGSWLATVDEWQPPTRNLDSFTEDLSSAVLLRQEVYLKFWQWNSGDQTWELVSRVDAPHTARHGSSTVGKVLGLAADPKSLKFSTIGEDRVVRVWGPKTRKRDNVIVRGKDGKPLRSWSCRNAVALPVDESDVEAMFEDSVHVAVESTACLAYSEDGSILSAAVSGSENGSVHLINPETGSIHNSRVGRFAGDIVKMAILDQYLITLSDELRIHDLVNEQLCYGLVISKTMRALSIKQKLAMVHFAIDKTNCTFAVAIPHMKHSEESKKKPASSYWANSTDITVFDPKNPVPLYTISLPSMVTTLLPYTSSSGYLVLDSFAEIRTLTPRVRQTALPQPTRLPAVQPDTTTIEETPAADILQMVQEEEEASGEGTIVVIPEDEEQDVEYPFVTQQQVTAIFDIPAFTLPPIEELFYRVTELYNGKPVSQPVV